MAAPVLLCEVAFATKHELAGASGRRRYDRREVISHARDMARTRALSWRTP
jgi:hypothetical protein